MTAGTGFKDTFSRCTSAAEGPGLQYLRYDDVRHPLRSLFREMLPQRLREGALIALHERISDAVLCEDATELSAADEIMPPFLNRAAQQLMNSRARAKTLCQQQTEMQMKFRAVQKSKNCDLKAWNRFEPWRRFLQAYRDFVEAFAVADLRQMEWERSRARGRRPRRLCAVLYQEQPVLRVVFPGAHDPSKPHRDLDYGHFPQEINYWVPLSETVNRRNTLYSESRPGNGDYLPFEFLGCEPEDAHAVGVEQTTNTMSESGKRQDQEPQPGPSGSAPENDGNERYRNAVRFDGMHCHHYAHVESECGDGEIDRKINAGESDEATLLLTRVSFDFRVLPIWECDGGRGQQTDIKSWTARTLAGDFRSPPAGAANFQLHRQLVDLVGHQTDKASAPADSRCAAAGAGKGHNNTDFHSLSSTDAEGFNRSLRHIVALLQESSSCAQPESRRWRIADNQHGLFRLLLVADNGSDVVGA